MGRFFLHQLRTTDPDGARAFYAAVFGNAEADVFLLHEQALARGARPHWLGFIDVSDVDAAVSAFVARGATQLGPKWNRDGLEGVVLRDPGGAVVALGKPPGDSAVSPKPSSVFRTAIGWHLLHTAHVDQAKTHYRDLFGWEFKDPVETANHGVFHPFAWSAGGPVAGAMADIAARTGVHPHWLFAFRVSSVESALAAARWEGASSVQEPAMLSNASLADGGTFAACDDPQGAAFALIEPR
jgi:predicted enzyme related to lactoylglutathione lyase